MSLPIDRETLEEILYMFTAEALEAIVGAIEDHLQRRRRR